MHSHRSLLGPKTCGHAPKKLVYFFWALHDSTLLRCGRAQKNKAGHTHIEVWLVQQGPDEFLSVCGHPCLRKVDCLMDFCQRGMLVNLSLSMAAAADQCILTAPAPPEEGVGEFLLLCVDGGACFFSFGLLAEQKKLTVHGHLNLEIWVSGFEELLKTCFISLKVAVCYTNFLSNFL